MKKLILLTSSLALSACELDTNTADVSGSSVTPTASESNTPEPSITPTLLPSDEPLITPTPLPTIEPTLVDWPSRIVPEQAFLTLNDTGITDNANFIARNSYYGSSRVYFAQQDAFAGRDAQSISQQLLKQGSGHGGFDFTKLDDLGDELDNSAQSWSCIRDNVTGLIWLSQDITATNQVLATDTIDENSPIQQANSENQCGQSDWRLPNVQEALSIQNFAGLQSNLDRDYFANSGAIWTTDQGTDANGEVDSTANHYVVNFVPYIAQNDDEHLAVLVANELGALDFATEDNCEATIAVTQYQGKDYYFDHVTGLVWHHYTDVSFANFATIDTIQMPDNESWRLPNLKELASLRNYSCGKKLRLDISEQLTMPIWSASFINDYRYSESIETCPNYGYFEQERSEETAFILTHDSFELVSQLVAKVEYNHSDPNQCVTPVPTAEPASRSNDSAMAVMPTSPPKEYGQTTWGSGWNSETEQQVWIVREF